MDRLDAAPSAEYQITFLANVQRILSEGQFTASYKFALLLSLADLAIELGDDSGAALAIPTERIAESFIGYYWRHVVPYLPGPAATGGIILHQNTDRQAAVVNFVREARLQHGDSLPALKQHTKAWRTLVSKVENIFWQQPLWRLQRVGEQALDFLYESRPVGTRVDTVILRPGAAYALRRFYPLITQLVRGSWLQFIRKTNAAALGSKADLMEFLFGSERADVSALRPALLELQHGQCFYCGKNLRGSGHLDHFVPWSRYPIDLGHNFVLADERCNSAKGAMLAVLPYRERWEDRNQEHGSMIADQCVLAKMRADLRASLQIAAWAYGQAAAVGAAFWG